ncbi:hypothetical protein BS78_08G135000 [Paspalum vaginatum]|nr:hypothetical protein BS78_08G135000 [Paspalum vaginatum]
MDLHRGRGANGRSMLHLAVAGGVLHLCRYLVEEAGFDVNSLSFAGETPILVATDADEDRGDGVAAVVRCLLDRGADPAAPCKMGQTPLHNAAENGHHEAVRLLLSKGVPVDTLNGRGAPLHIAAAKGQDQAVKVLLEHGADPNRVVLHVLSPLSMACYGNSLKCMKLLVEAGADVNLKSSPGGPVLFAAVDEGFTDIVKFLLEAGANPNIQDDDGKIPIMHAAASEKRELVEILLPWTKPIPSLPDWSVDGIVRTMKHLKFEPKELDKERLADLKSQGKEAFAKRDYRDGIYYYTQAIDMDPQDATLYTNRSLCWLRLQEGRQALLDARHCKKLRPRWAKPCYLEGMAFRLFKEYKRAVGAFEEALKLDAENNEITQAIRDAKVATMIPAQN